MPNLTFSMRWAEKANLEMQATEQPVIVAGIGVGVRGQDGGRAVGASVAQPGLGRGDQPAERFRAASNPSEVKRLGEQLGRFVFGE